MIAANPWHWWIGVVLMVAAVGALGSVVAGYVSKVSATLHQWPVLSQAVRILCHSWFWHVPRDYL